MLTSKIGKYRGLLGRLGEPIRPVGKTGPTGLGNIIKLLIGLHHCLDLVKTIEMHIWNVQFGVRMRKLCLPDDLHPGQTGPGAVRPVRRPVRPVRNVQSELGVVF